MATLEHVAILLPQLLSVCATRPGYVSVLKQTNRQTPPAFTIAYVFVCVCVLYQAVLDA